MGVGLSGKVLIATDNPLHIKLAERALEALPKVELMTADNKMKALARVFSDRPRVVIIGFNDPIENYSLSRSIRQSRDHRRLPLIFLSEEYSFWNRVRAFFLGVADYLIIPVSPDLLTRKINGNLA